MKDKIKYVLCNENGGPNVEHLIGIVLALIFMACIVKIYESTKELDKSSISRTGAMDDYFG